MRQIGPFEAEVLRAIQARPLASASEVSALVAEQTKREAPSVSQLYISLGKIEARGLAQVSIRTAEPVKGGRRKKLFTITEVGARKLKEFEERYA